MKKNNILIVEDEGIVAKHIKTTLERAGYNVTATVVSGEDALLSLKKKKPDLVLMDIKLKGKMNGIQAAKKIYKEQKIPVIFLTAYANDKLIQLAKKSEPFGYLVKPFEETGLKTSIEIALYKSKMSQKLRQAHDSLEDKVRQRTAELQKTNEALEQEIAERKKVEDEKSKVLEDLNDRMKELTSVSYSAKILKNEMLRSQLEHSHMQEAKHKIFEALQERVKEMALLRNMTKLLQNYNKPLEELMEEIVSIIPLGWKYSDIAAARFFFDNKETASPNFVKTKWKQTADFRTDDGKIGIIEVNYLEEMPDEFEGPFLLEERNLINSLALMLKSYFNSSGIKSLWDHQFLLDSLEQPAWYFLDPENFGVVNSAFADLLGQSKKSLEYGKIAQVLSDDNASVLSMMSAKAFESREPWENEILLGGTSGSKKLFRVRILPKINDDEKTEHVLCVARVLGK